jgi:hypothetical protein
MKRHRSTSPEKKASSKTSNAGNLRSGGPKQTGQGQSGVKGKTTTTTTTGQDDSATVNFTKREQADLFVTGPQRPVPTIAEMEIALVDLAREIQADHPDTDSAEHAYAAFIERLAETSALAPMKKIGITDLTAMSDIVAQRGTYAPDTNDERIRQLTSLARDCLMARRPHGERFVLPGQKKQNMQTIPAKKQSDEARAWLAWAYQRLDQDGFNDQGQLVELEEKTDTLLTRIADGKAGPSDWAELQGYVFQINEIMKARSRYRLTDVESPFRSPATGNLRYADSIELLPIKGGPPAICYCEYKSYSKTTSKTYEKEFGEQLDDYVAKVTQDGETRQLRYVFREQGPSWAQQKLVQAAKDLEAAGKILFLTQGISTSVVGRTMLTEFAKPGQTIANNAPPPVDPVPTPPAVTPPADTPPADTPPADTPPADMETTENRKRSSSQPAPVTPPAQKKQKTLHFYFGGNGPQNATRPTPANTGRGKKITRGRAKSARK